MMDSPQRGPCLRVSWTATQEHGRPYARWPPLRPGQHTICHISQCILVRGIITGNMKAVRSMAWRYSEIQVWTDGEVGIDMDAQGHSEYRSACCMVGQESTRRAAQSLRRGALTRHAARGVRLAARACVRHNGPETPPKALCLGLAEQETMASCSAHAFCPQIPDVTCCPGPGSETTASSPKFRLIQTAGSETFEASSVESLQTGKQTCVFQALAEVL